MTLIIQCNECDCFCIYFADTQFTMPIFEYICQDCKQPFEALVLGSRKPECPKCHGHNLAQQFSVFAAASHSSPAAASCGAAPST